MKYTPNTVFPPAAGKRGVPVSEEGPAAAAKHVLAQQLAEQMKKEKLSRTEMAARMQTSRSAVARLLDPQNTSISLQTMERAARALGKKLEIQLVD